VINLKIRDYIDIFKKYDILDCEIDEDCSNVQFTVSVYKDSDIEIVMDFTDDSDTYDGDDIDIKFWISFGMITLWEIRYEDIKEIRYNHRYPELISDVIKVCHEFEDVYITRRMRDEEISELRQKYYQMDKESEE
jgi:hypothetical protein